MTIDLDLDFGLRLDANTKALDANTRTRRMAMERAKALTPQNLRLTTSASSAASGDLGMSLGGPDPGFIWQVRRMSIAGTNPTSTAAGTGEVYITGLSGPVGTSHTGYTTIRDSNDLADLFASFTGTGAVHFYSTGQFILNANENIEVVVRAPTASTLYKVSIALDLIRTPASIVEYGGAVEI